MHHFAFAALHAVTECYHCTIQAGKVYKWMIEAVVLLLFFFLSCSTSRCALLDPQTLDAVPMVQAGRVYRWIMIEAATLLLFLFFL